MKVFRYILLLAALGTSCSDIHAADKKTLVYGAPGAGRIQVRVTGDFVHPGAYWLSPNSNVSQLVEVAKLTMRRKGDFDSPPIVLIVRQRNGLTEKSRFFLSELPNKAHNFKLEHNDVVRTDYLAF